MLTLPENLSLVNQSGYLLIDKPAGITSHDVIYKLRKITGIQKIGHAGTLDPFATGLLIVGVGRAATKHLGEITQHNKEYLATLKFGATSDTQDLTGQMVNTKGSDPRGSDPKVVKGVLSTFIGEIEQIPPMFSAKKIAGKKLYELARAGQIIERKPVKITIYNIELLSYAWPRLQIKVSCGPGTYIRTLAHDLGQALGVGAYLTELRRTKIGRIDVTTAIELNKITTQNWTERLIARPRPGLCL